MDYNASLNFVVGFCSFVFKEILIYYEYYVGLHEFYVNHMHSKDARPLKLPVNHLIQVRGTHLGPLQEQ